MTESADIAGQGAISVAGLSLDLDGTFWTVLGLEIVMVSPERAIARQSPRQGLLGLDRFAFHGGVLMAAADCTAMLAAIAAAGAALEVHQVPVTAHFDVDFLHPARGPVRLESRVCHASRRSVLVDTAVTNHDRDVVLLARSRHVFRPDDRSEV